MDRRPGYKGVAVPFERGTAPGQIVGRRGRGTRKKAGNRLLILQHHFEQTIPTTAMGAFRLIDDIAESIELISHPNSAKVAFELQQIAKLAWSKAPGPIFAAGLPELLLSLLRKLEEDDACPIKPEPPKHARRLKSSG